MNLLLDANIFIWMSMQPNKLSPALRAALQNPAYRAVLSVVSLWEMQIKYQNGKLSLPAPVQRFVTTQVRLRNIQLLPVSDAHVWMLNVLPLHHRDPFDRLLIAQAIVEGYTLASADAVFQKYPVALFSA